MIREIKYTGHEEWLELRKHLGIGGSEAGAVMGLDAYKSPYALWAEKTGRISGFDGNITTKVGSCLEELAAQMFTEQTGKKVRRKNAILVNDDFPFAFADVDRLVVGENSLLEIKTTNSFPVMRNVRNGEFPDRWWCQICHYMAVTGCEKAYLAALVNCREFYVFELAQDEEEIAALMDSERLFWELVQSDTPPGMDGSIATADAIGEIYSGGGGEIELFGRESMLREYFDLKDRQKALSERICEIENTLKTDMGDAEKALCGGFTVSWKPQQRHTFDLKTFTKEYPEIDVKPFCKVSGSRPFRVTRKEL